MIDAPTANGAGSTNCTSDANSAPATPGPVGVRAPAHVVTPGIAILSTFSDARLDAWITGHDFASFSAHTVTDPKRFRTNVRSARALDYWTTEQQLDLGLAGIAVAVKNRKGECVGAIGMTVQMQNNPSDRLVQTLLPALRDAAQSLRAVL